MYICIYEKVGEGKTGRYESPRESRARGFGAVNINQSPSLNIPFPSGPERRRGRKHYRHEKSERELSLNRSVKKKRTLARVVAEGILMIWKEYLHS